MSDDIDRAVDLNEKLLEAKIAKQRVASQSRSLHPVGTCYYCNCQVNRGQLFCDSICGEDYESEQEARRRNGG